MCVRLCTFVRVYVCVCVCTCVQRVTVYKKPNRITERSILFYTYIYRYINIPLIVSVLCSRYFYCVLRSSSVSHLDLSISLYFRAWDLFQTSTSERIATYYFYFSFFSSVVLFSIERTSARAFVLVEIKRKKLTCFRVVCSLYISWDCSTKTCRFLNLHGKLYKFICWNNFQLENSRKIKFI